MAVVGRPVEKLVTEAKQDWHLYMIRSADDSLYTGISTDVQRRLLEHKSESAGAPRGAKALRGKHSLEVVYQTRVGNRSEASKLEYRVKQLSKKEKEALVCGELDILQLIG